MTGSRSEPLTATAAHLALDAESRLEHVRDQLTEADRRLRRFVHAQPLTAVLCAIVAGYVAARILRRL